MIDDRVAKALAVEQGVDPMVIELDHALGVVLWALAETPGSEPAWLFKGGTCLKKAYFADYRFSVDLDFTVLGRLLLDDAESRLRRMAVRAEEVGVELLVREARTKVTDDVYGRESVELRVPFRGALRRRGEPSKMQFHLSADEQVMMEVRSRTLLHPYDDAPEVSCELECYALEEMLAEKLRAVGGQRRYAIARDVYDVAELVRRGADVEDALRILPEKAQLKDVILEGSGDRFRDRREEYEANWNVALGYLVDDAADFGEAFETTANVLDRASRMSAS